MKRYDYVIIGAGAAGAVLANRLTEDKSVSVMLVEAGGEQYRHLFTRIPIAFLQTYRREKFGWCYESEPEPGLNGRRLEFFRGRALGGSTIVNGMYYTRGNRLDYDGWRQRGSEGWSYNDVLPYFKRLETSWRGENRYHGAGGPIQIKMVDDPLMPYQALEDAAVCAGIARSDDLYGDITIGVGRAELTVGRGERSSVATAYIEPALRRRNLTVAKQTHTKRILFERKRAVGIEVESNGELIRIYAEREVILSAGTYNSPQILMLSGIGSADHLREMGITPIVDLPAVGQNLQDHPMVSLTWAAKGRDTFLKYLRLDRAGLAALRWAVARSGPFTSTGCYATIYANTRSGLTRPDVQLVASAVGLDATFWFPGLTAKANHRFVSIVSANHANSRGWVKLRSADPKDRPRIFFNVLNDPADLQTLIGGIRLARRVYNEEPQHKLIGGELLPGPRILTDEDLAAYVRGTLRSAEHPIGTCSMGHGHDAVVDPQLRVYGVEGLRVIDASVMPDMPGGNINIPTIMIAERGADLIRGRVLEPADVAAA